MYKLSGGVHRVVSCLLCWIFLLNAACTQRCAPSKMLLHLSAWWWWRRRPTTNEPPSPPFMRSRCVGTELDRLQDSPALLSSRSSSLIVSPYLQRHLSNSINSLQTTKACLLFRLHTAVLVCLLIRAFVLSSGGGDAVEVMQQVNDPVHFTS